MIFDKDIRERILHTAKVVVWALAIAFAMLAMTYVGSAASQESVRCQNIKGEIIIMAPPYLCPPGTWQV